MTANFWIPPAARSRDETRYNCLSCGSTGVDQQHVIDCSRAHEDIEHALVSRDKSVWNGKPVDEDLEAWVKAYASEIIAGRKKL